MMIRRIQELYRDNGLIMQKQAVYMFIVCCILVVVLPAMALMAYMNTPERIAMVLSGIVPVLVTNIATMALILRGRYTVAGYLNVSCIFIGAVYISLSTPGGAAFYRTLYYTYALIVFALLFSGRLLATLVAVFSVATAVLYYSLQGANVDRGFLTIALFSFAVSTVLVYIVSLLMLSILKKAITISQEESATSRRLLEINRKLLSQVDVQIASLLNVSREVSDASRSIEESAQRQAGGIEEIASSLEEMGANISQNADNAGSASRMSVEALARGEEGGGIVRQAVESINEINLASGKIRDIVAVINDIAFQTNLLALNASVEAARAGMDGRGFAVVASEVRNLSLRSGGSAKEIGALIGDSIDKINNGTRLVNMSGQALERIIDSTKGVRAIIEELAAATAEQRLGIDQINEAVTDIDALTQENVSAAGRLTSTVLILNENAAQLKSLMKESR